MHRVAAGGYNGTTPRGLFYSYLSYLNFNIEFDKWSPVSIGSPQGFKKVCWEGIF
jgi:hypothetical protein